MAHTTQPYTFCIAVRLPFRFALKDADESCLRVDPDLLPHAQVDKGAIKFVLAGANIMWSVCS